ncbi:MAG: hypothetical protein P8R54_26860 [Myxococcota bacterium]|nr:hypothetical protein [Myxococcota bacterium]
MNLLMGILTSMTAAAVSPSMDEDGRAARPVLNIRHDPSKSHRTIPL